MNDSDYQKKIAELLALLDGILIDEGLFIATNMIGVMLAEIINQSGAEHSNEVMRNVIDAITKRQAEYIQSKKREFAHAG